MEFVRVLLLLAIIVGFIWLIFKWYKLSSAKFIDRVKGLNDEHKTNFGTDHFLGNWGNCMLFDRQNKRIALLRGPKVEVLDYDYVTRWEYLFNMRRSGQLIDQRIVLRTRDLDRPQLFYPMLSEAQAREWMARLDVLFNRE